MIGIHTHSTKLYHLEYWKYILARYIFHKRRGPDAVCKSLLRGLKQLNAKFLLNPKQPCEVTLVLSGTKALRQAIALKRTGKIKKLIVGPNLVIHPYHAKKIICDTAIDTILIPSIWPANYWKQEAPEIAERIHIWPAGVEVSVASSRKGAPIVYNKINDQRLLNEVIKQVCKSLVFTYGNYRHSDYLKALSKAPYMIFLSTSESQGLALHEAWSHDVPTLVNQSDLWKSGDMTWNSPQINAPYLTPKLGAIFKKPDDIPDLINTIRTLNPKPYSDLHFSDVACAQKLLNLI